MALKDFYSAHENHKTRLVLHVRDSREQVIDAAAVDVEVDAIVGPQKSAQANFVMDLGDRAHVPVISFSATSPSVLSRTQYFVQTALSDDTQVGAIAAIVEAFLWREVVIINEDTDYGNGVIPYLSNALKETARISYRSIIPLSASDDFIEKELYKMMTIQTRVFVVHMSHFLGTRLFLKAKEIGMLSEGYVWIITNGLMDLLSMDSNVIEAMQGVLGVKPHVPQSKRLDFFQNNPNSTIKQDESSIFGLWSDDTMWALAMAAEKVGLETPINNIENISTMNSINLFNFRISQTGPKLLEAMLGTTFEGLSGKFSLLNGQLNPSPFQILNVVGNQGREVAIWRQSYGISKKLNENATKNCFSCPKENFHTIIWPGGSTNVPVSGKKLRIAVPMSGFNQFVKMEIVRSVISALPYAVRYEFVPFKIVDGSSSLSYNDMVYQVSLKEFES
ncbi:glutamate receptor 2.2-like [Camellia sinensis]|uniref:glutamate receptor 2.2-like n=1 Tax=Camellia sinensis TaxID=4442 RepID=UPI0010355DB7|nr:glutamate receptor 2.2-like [Camellia sinensis]